MKNFLVLYLEKNGLPSDESTWGYLDIPPFSPESHVHLFSLPEAKHQPQLPLLEGIFAQAGPAWQCYEYARDGIYLFQELGRWSLVLSRQKVPIYCRDLAMEYLSSRSVNSVRQVIMQLQSLGAIEHPPSITILGPSPSREFIAALRSQNIKTFTTSPLPPRVPNPWITMIPEKIRKKNLERTKKASLKRNLTLVISAALFMLLALGSIWFLKNQELERAQQQLESLTPVVKRLQETESAWKRIELAVEPGLYPLETLHRITNKLPDKGIRITEFQQNNHSFSLEGEASNATLVFDLIKEIQSSPDCSHINSKAPSIKSLPGNKTRFTIQAELKYPPHE